MLKKDSCGLFTKNKQYRNALVQSEKIIDNLLLKRTYKKTPFYVKAKAIWCGEKGSKPIFLLEQLKHDSHTAAGAEAFFCYAKMLLT